MKVHLPALDYDVMDPAPAAYEIRIHGRLDLVEVRQLNQ